MRSLRTLALLCLTAAPLAAQDITVTIDEPKVPGTVVQVAACPAFDSLVPGTHKLKAALFRSAGVADSIVLTSEPFVGEDFEKWAIHYFWIAATVPPAPLGHLPQRIQVILYSVDKPIISSATPPDAHLRIRLTKDSTLDFGQLLLDASHRNVHIADEKKHPNQGQAVYTWVSGETLLPVLLQKKARVILPEGSFAFSDGQRAGMQKVLMGAMCGVQ